MNLLFAHLAVAEMMLPLRELLQSFLCTRFLFRAGKKDEVRITLIIIVTTITALTRSFQRNAQNMNLPLFTAFSQQMD